MRFDTFTRAIYTAYRSFVDAGGAALLALMLIALSGVLLVFEHKLRGDPRSPGRPLGALGHDAGAARAAGSPWACASAARSSRWRSRCR